MLNEMKMSCQTTLSCFMAAVATIGLSTSGFAAADKFTDEVHQSYPLASDGRVELANVNGTIRITTWDRTEVKLDAVKKANKQADLDAVKIDVSSTPGRISIRTKYPDPKSGWFRSKQNSTSVDYALTVPRRARLDKVSNINGAVKIEGVRGAIDTSTVNGRLTAIGIAKDATLSSVNGAVEAAFDQFDGVNSVTLSTVNGKATLNLPKDANATVTANTVNGDITADQPLQVNRKWPVGRSLEGSLGRGDTRIKVSTVNGSIAIKLGVASAQAKVEDDR